MHLLCAIARCLCLCQYSGLPPFPYECAVPSVVASHNFSRKLFGLVWLGNCSFLVCAPTIQFGMGGSMDFTRAQRPSQCLCICLDCSCWQLASQRAAMCHTNCLKLVPTLNLSDCIWPYLILFEPVRHFQLYLTPIPISLLSHSYLPLFDSL